MIRVLHVINWLRAGGVETQLMHVLREYDRSRFHMDVCVIGPEMGYLASGVRELGSSVVSCRKSPNLWGFSGRFAGLVSPLGYDIVHSHFEGWSGAILRGARLAGVPVRIAHLHSIRPWPQTAKFGLFVHLGRRAVLAWGRHWVRLHSTHVLAVSRAVMEERLVERWNGKDNLFLWTGGVDTTKFSPAPAAKRSDRDTIIWVGGLLPGKGIDVQLRALRLVLRAIPAARLVLVGEGKSEPELRELSDRLGVSASVDFLGVRHDVPELLRSASVFLSCSREEGLPTVILEAQAAGLPVVATDIEPHREGLTKELHPYLFPVDSPEDAAKSLVRLLKDAALREKLGRHGRDYVVDKYDASSQLALLQEYYARWTRDGRTIPCPISTL